MDQLRGWAWAVAVLLVLPANALASQRRPDTFDPATRDPAWQTEAGQRVRRVAARLTPERIELLLRLDGLIAGPVPPTLALPEPDAVIEEQRLLGRWWKARSDLVHWVYAGRPTTSEARVVAKFELVARVLGEARLRDLEAVAPILARRDPSIPGLGLYADRPCPIDLRIEWNGQGTRAEQVASSLRIWATRLLADGFAERARAYRRAFSAGAPDAAELTTRADKMAAIRRHASQKDQARRDALRASRFSYDEQCLLERGDAYEDQDYDSAHPRPPAWFDLALARRVREPAGSP